jgi:hypothetical protein
MSKSSNKGLSGVSAEDLYYIMEDGDGFEHKIANPKNLEVCPREGVMEVKAMYAKKRQPDFLYKVFRDPQSKIIYGIPIGINKDTKAIEFKGIRLGDNRLFDLTVETDALEWMVTARAGFLEGSALQRGKPSYKVHNQEAIAKKKISLSMSRARAEKIARNVFGNEMNDFARTLGLTPENNSEEMLRAMLIDKAFDPSTTQEFLQAWESADRPIVTIFKRGIATGVITQDVNKGFLFKGTLPLGFDEPAAIAELRSNTHVLMQVNTESKALSKSFNLEEDEKDKNKETELSDDEVIASQESEIEALKKQLKESKEDAKANAPEVETPQMPVEAVQSDAIEEEPQEAVKEGFDISN